MKKHVRTIVSVLVVMLMAIPLFNHPISAATGSQGYAVYRDGVLNGLNWHTGIMYDPSRNTSSLPVIHHPGNGYARFGTWDQFMDGKTFMGVYGPKGGIVSVCRDLVKSMSLKVATDQISYYFGGQMVVNPAVYSSGQAKIEPKDITHFRCDGVVEYCYEYYNYRIYGIDAWWNISKNNYDNVYHHNNIVTISPYLQATQYMTKISSVLP